MAADNTLVFENFTNLNKTPGFFIAAATSMVSMFKVEVPRETDNPTVGFNNPSGISAICT